MSDLSSLGIGLIVFFSITFTALFVELCYILIRRRNKSKVEPAGAPTTAHPNGDNAGDELEKWQEIHGPLRGLFTIKEEEKEDLESEKSCSGRKTKKRGCLGEEEEEKENVVVILGFERESETPYYTPFSSPPREVGREEKEVNVVGREGCFIVEVEAERGFLGLDR